MKFGPELCYVIVQNRGTLDEFYRRLEALARFAGLSRCQGDLNQVKWSSTSGCDGGQRIGALPWS